MTALYVKMKDPATGKTEVFSPQNALDLEQHNGWIRVGHVRVNEVYISQPQDVLDGAKELGSKASAARRRNAANASNTEELDVPVDVVDTLEDLTADAKDEDPDATPADVDPDDAAIPADADPDDAVPAEEKTTGRRKQK